MEHEALIGPSPRLLMNIRHETHDEVLSCFRGMPTAAIVDMSILVTAVRSATVLDEKQFEGLRPFVTAYPPSSSFGALGRNTVAASRSSKLTSHQCRQHSLCPRRTLPVNSTQPNPRRSNLLDCKIPGDFRHGLLHSAGDPLGITRHIWTIPVPFLSSMIQLTCFVTVPPNFQPRMSSSSSLPIVLCFTVTVAAHEDCYNSASSAFISLLSTMICSQVASGTSSFSSPEKKPHAS